ncbi:uncharacterized protein N7498_010845 [Penicillium cinerascens]|uniref:PH domain-containing protein n=1 Tax=Penicillium cinerascens TaxID=70096 RepID=A0A9W9M786_9EURO|nr:uncharacterized protein N7498_010845 [Penicillium cinerascens]KAJ5191860.1 hypothetical protein N7498_010845 [Penicillium cinerascens]
MVKPAVSATDTAPQKMSRYRSVREAKGADCHELPVQSTQSAVGTTNDQNPSIARSMSRYRRNRPSANSSTVAAAAPPTPPMPDHARAQAQVDAMAQLTGGKETSFSKPLRSVKSEKVQVEKDGAKTKATRSTPEARDLEGRQANAHASPNDKTRKSFFQRVGLSKNKDSMNSDESAPRYIGVGGGGIVPGIDAPISAVNAGERRVTVQYHNTSVELPVTPSTQVQDLLLSASKKLSRDIDPEQFIVIESFHQVGLERNLRRYERVRDVMNSWAHDGDNQLIVIPPSSMDALAQLDAQLVPSEKPGETSVYLYYSQRPGKWNKRYVTLCPNGQVTIAKKESAKDHIAICHLSDFDVYRPNARALAKEIKPPKKICVAIKSQQKSSMFLSTDKFVHFFSTNDHATADRWLKVTQAWRSWYLVNKMGVTEKIEPDVSLPARSLTNRLTDDSGPRPSTSRAQKKSSREHAPPPSSFPKDLAIDTTVGGYGPAPGRPSEEMEATTFSPGGLLGRTYTQRKNAMHEREEREKRAKEQPFTEQGLLNESPAFSPEYSSNHQNHRSNTMTRAPDGLRRSLSASQKPKPLLDLTPVFQEPPQHTRKGRGVTVEPGVKLVDAATGPEFAVSAVAIPSATTWRRPSAEVSSQTPYRSNTARSIRQASQPHKPSQMSSAEGSPTVPTNPFQPNSLLASSNRVAGQSKPFKGRGVATGDRNATQPLLDMSPENPFAEGSLLQKL